MDASTGTMQLIVPGCIVRRKKNLFPAAATHFRIVSCAGSVNFNQQRFSSNIAKSELLPLGKKMPALQLQHSLQAQPGQVMLHTAGIVFYKVEDGEETLLRGGALKIVQVARKEKVVATPVTGTPAHTAMPHTCANNPKTDQPAIAVSVANNLPPEQAAVPPKTRKPTRLRGYYTSRKREAVRMSGLSR
jgi:flagellar basal body rod protein FlgF